MPLHAHSREFPLPLLPQWMSLPVDPWGRPYIYVSPGQHHPEYDLKSLGADGFEGGEHYNVDLESWQARR